MFTWICPKCKSEVPPSYSECPNCAAAGAAPPQKEGPPSAPAPAQTLSQPSPPRPAAAASQPRLPGWALTILFALGFAVLLGVGYYAYRGLTQKNSVSRPTAPPVDGPRLPSNAEIKAHPIAEYIEVTGLRLTEDTKQKAFVQFVVVNHSGAEITGLAGNVNLIAVTAKGEKEPVGAFAFKIPSLGPYESKELKGSVTTKLRVYELPDWQFLRAETQITAP
jgi:hypothetical protein